MQGVEIDMVQRVKAGTGDRCDKLLPLYAGHMIQPLPTSNQHPLILHGYISKHGVYA